MAELVAKFTDQAAEIVKMRPSHFEALDNDPLDTRDLINKYVQAQIEHENDNGTYRITRKQLIDTDHLVLEEMDRRLREIAGERGLSVMVETELETGDCIVRWWKE